MWSAIKRSFSGFDARAVSSNISSVFVRHFSRKRAENLKKINPRATPQEASSIASNLYWLINLRGPLTVSNAWNLCKESGIGELSSKTHMKLLLKWMRGRKMLKLSCKQAGSNKKFLLSTLPEDEIGRSRVAAELKKLSENPTIQRIMQLK